MAWIDFHQENRWHNLFYDDPAVSEVQSFQTFLKENRDEVVRLYHGTKKEIPVVVEGLLPATKTRRNSYQSASGYVCLSVYPDMARTFGQMAFPKKEITVYAVDVPIKELKADRDQLANKRYWAEQKLGNTLAESLVYGRGARIKGKIDPTWIQVHE